jgi:hypothetical protein
MSGVTDVRMCECDRCKNGTQVEYGKCHCGCGRATSVPVRNSKSRNQIKGQPVAFISGHHTKSANHLTKPKVDRPSTAMLLELYRGGMSAKHIAHWYEYKFNQPINSSTVYKWLRLAGIPRRTLSESARLRALEDVSKHRAMAQRARAAIVQGKFRRRCNDEECNRLRKLSRKACRIHSVNAKRKRIVATCNNPTCNVTRSMSPSYYSKLRNHPYLCFKHAQAKTAHERKLANMARSIPIRNQRPDWLTEEEWTRLQENTAS